MQFTSTRIVTADIKPLVAFYELVTGRSAAWYGEDFAELRTSVGALAIGSTRTLDVAGVPQVAQAAANRSVIIEFRVDDVDAEFQRLEAALGTGLEQAPTTMPWGNRSLLFRDPDGNLVNFFTPVTPAALARLDG